MICVIVIMVVVLNGCAPRYPGYWVWTECSFHGISILLSAWKLHAVLICFVFFVVIASIRGSDRFALWDKYVVVIKPLRWHWMVWHYTDVIMTTMASQITSLTVVYSTVYSDADQRKHQSSASLAFVWGIHRDRWIPRTKGQLRGKCFHLMTSPWGKWPPQHKTTRHETWGYFLRCTVLYCTWRHITRVVDLPLYPIWTNVRFLEYWTPDHHSQVK